MTITEYTHNLEKFQKNLSQFIFNKVADYAKSDILAQVANRVITTQTDANGVKFSTYSWNPILSSGGPYVRGEVELLPSLWETGKVKKYQKGSAKGKTAIKRKGLEPRILNWVTIKKNGKNIHLFEIPGGYAELRRLHGRTRNNNKSFDFSGQTWKEFNVIGKKADKTGFLVRMGGTTPIAQNIINWQSEAEDIAIIGMTKEEQELLHKNVDIWIEQFANECKIA